MKKLRVTKGVYFFTPTGSENGNYSITFRALSEKELNSLEILVNDGRTSEAVYRSAQLATISIEDSSGDKIKFLDLPIEVLYEFNSKLLQISTITQEELEKLYTNINLYTSDSLTGETWTCEVCREKRLDKTRNCKYLSEEEQEQFWDPEFNIRVGKDYYTHCPIFDIDNELLADAIECNNYLELGFLPDAGGFLDQTRFFVVASQHMKFKLQEAELRRMKAQQKEH